LYRLRRQPNLTRRDLWQVNAERILRHLVFTSRFQSFRFISTSKHGLVAETMQLPVGLWVMCVQCTCCIFSSYMTDLKIAFSCRGRIFVFQSPVIESSFYYYYFTSLFLSSFPTASSDPLHHLLKIHRSSCIFVSFSILYIHLIRIKLILFG